MTSDMMTLSISLAAGVVIGAFYFCGLWWTVCRIMNRKNSPLLTPVSFGVRSAAALAGFYWVMDGHWENLLMCLLGFTLARLWLIRKMTPAAEKPPVVVNR